MTAAPPSGARPRRPSERVNEPYFSKTRDLLDKVAGLELIEIDRPDECCGFGGSFCVTDEAVSAKMGYDRVHDFYRHGPSTSPRPTCPACST